MENYYEQLRAIAADAGLLKEGDVAKAIYTRYYCSPRSQPAATLSREERLQFVSRLSVANCGTGHWEAGWHVVDRSDGKLVVTKGNVRFYARQSDVRFDGDRRPGASCRVRLGKEYRALQPGFYCALGNADESPDAKERRFRIYWNLRASGAATYVAAVTESFNQRALSFRAKVLSDPAEFARADAGVLYLERRDVEAAAPILRTLSARLQPVLEDDVPLFTKPLARGVSLAEDPGSDESFGQSRSRIIASALLTRASRSSNERFDAMCDTLEKAGINLDEPYLCGGQSTTYAALFS